MERKATDNEIKGMKWWNGLDEAHRRFWMDQVGNTGRVIDAWECSKRVGNPALHADDQDSADLPVYEAGLDLPIRPRSAQEVERAGDLYMQLQYLGLESLTNLLHSLEAEIVRKGGQSPILWKKAGRKG
jgi:hypothetical protein